MDQPMGDARLLLVHIRHMNRMFWREPLAAFFTMAFPVMFLVLFGFIFGSGEVRGVPYTQFFTPAIAVFAAATATFTNLTIGVAITRDEGILKRVRGTPAPPLLHMSGRVLSAVWTAFLAIVLMFTLGWALFDFTVVWRNVPSALLVFAAAAATFSAMGLAVCSLVKTGTTAPAVANGIILPMAFLSDIFIPLDAAPSWLQVIGDVFPLKHFGALLGRAFTPSAVADAMNAGPVLAWERFGVMAAWLLVSMFIAIRFFRWEPRGGG